MVFQQIFKEGPLNSNMKKRDIYLFVVTFMLVFLGGLIIGDYLDNQKKEDTDFSTSNEFFDEGSKKIELQVPAIDNKGEGVVATLETNIRTGTGLVLVNINDVIAGYTTQHSSRTAVKAAESYLDRNLTNLDVVYNIKADASFVDGPSIGGAMAISLISLVENKSINNQTSITGSIDEKGVIGPASGIEQKADALKKENFEKLLVSDQVALPRDHVRKKSCSYIEGKEYCKIDYVEEGDLIISGLNIKSVMDLEESMEVFYGE